MVTAGEYRIRRIVAVWQDWQRDDGPLYVVPPCGTCREFMRQVHPENLKTEVVLGIDRTLPLAELLPHHDWPGDPVRLDA